MATLTLKRCSRCGQSQELSCFHKDRTTSDGLCAICRNCKKTRMAAYNAQPDVVAKVKTQKAQYYLDNKPYILQRTKAYAVAHPELYRQAYKSWQKRNLPDMARRARERRAMHATAPCIPYTLDQLAARLSMFPCCYLCGGEVQAVDHVKPLSKGGWDCLANFRGICTPCNSKKKDKWPYLPALVIRGWSHRSQIL